MVFKMHSTNTVQISPLNMERNWYKEKM